MVVELPRETALEVFTPLIRTVFFIVILVIGVVPVEPIKTTLGVVAEVFVIVRSRVVPPAEFEPSMITLLFNILMRAPAVMLPERLAVIPVFGLIVMVLVGLDPGIT